MINDGETLEFVETIFGVDQKSIGQFIHNCIQE